MILAGSGRIARAQAVRGIVLHADSVTRAAGVIVVATDASGTAVSRALTGESGEFEIRLPRAGDYQLRFLRIGYRPTIAPAFHARAAVTVETRAVLDGVAVLLATVTVQSENVCGSTNDAGRVVAQLWEDARTALTATQLTAQSGALNVEWEAFQFVTDRRLSRADRRVVDSRAGTTDRPFVGASAEALADEGYVIDEERDRIYRAPDAAALLSDRFAATHCFRVERPSRERPQWIGIAFRPVDGREWIRDISGTLWLDRATTELRLLEFRYTGLPREADDPAVGGFVEFSRMPTGHWFVSRWAIRTPRLAQRVIGGSGIPGGGRQLATVVEALDVTGGALKRARTSAGIVFAADPTALASGRAGAALAKPSECGPGAPRAVSISGMVTRGGTMASGAVVTAKWRPPGEAEDRSLSAVSDEHGVWNLTCVPAGSAVRLSAAADGVQSATLPVQASTAGPVGGLKLDLVRP